MTYTVMQKTDSMTSWHSLRDYDNEQEAKFQVMKWEKERGDTKYPQYDVIVSN